MWLRIVSFSPPSFPSHLILIQFLPRRVIFSFLQQVVVEACTEELHRTRVAFREALGDGQWSGSYDANWQVRGFHSPVGSGDVVSLPVPGERPVRLATAVLQRPHKVRIELKDGTVIERTIGLNNHEGTSAGMEGAALIRCLTQLKALVLLPLLNV
jgi:hypothetical protein